MEPNQQLIDDFLKQLKTGEELNNFLASRRTWSPYIAIFFAIYYEILHNLDIAFRLSCQYK